MGVVSVKISEGARAAIKLAAVRAGETFPAALDRLLGVEGTLAEGNGLDSGHVSAGACQTQKGAGTPVLRAPSETTGAEAVGTACATPEAASSDAAGPPVQDGTQSRKGARCVGSTPSASPSVSESPAPTKPPPREPKLSPFEARAAKRRAQGIGAQLSETGEYEEE